MTRRNPITAWSSLTEMIHWIKESRHMWRKFAKGNSLPEPNFDDILGAGNVGAVFGTKKADIVVKFSGLKEDAAVADTLIKNPGTPGFVTFYAIIEVSYQEKTGWLIWREKVEHTDYNAHRIAHGLRGEAEQKVYRSAHNALSLYDDVFDKFYDLNGISPEEFSAFKIDIKAAIKNIGKVHGFRDISKGLSALLQKNIFISDVKIDNIGLVKGKKQLVIYDGIVVTPMIEVEDLDMEF